ncbi:MAG: FAD-dependent oxidoreductase [Candidatus Bipolaricaulota bacterium]|nr:MAG: FAD-dependent oxidoreductase [Candidatus Bipolaricaulota bacterium]
MDDERSEESHGAENVVDVLVIGGGPAGATAALYAARARLTTRVLDRGLTSGALGTTHKITNYPGVTETLTGAELVERMREQAAAVGAEFLQERALGAMLDGAIKEVRTAQGVHRARALIVASGSMGRAVSLPGEERLLGRGVSYCATCDGFFFTDQEVAVVGDNDEAVEEALFLTRYAHKVHLVSPGSSLRATAALRQEAETNPKLQIHPATRAGEILGEARVEGLRLATGEAHEDLAVAAVFVYTQGSRPIVDFLDGQLELSDTGCIVVDEFMHSSVEGVFAAGDVLCKHLKQVVIAVAEGAVAAISAERYLAGREQLRPDWA